MIESFNYVSANELEDKINSVCVKNHDKLQSVNTTKLFEKNNIIIRFLLKNIKDHCHRIYADVPSSRWKVAVAEFRAKGNVYAKEVTIFKGLSFEGFMFHGDMAKECCSLKALSLIHQMEQQHKHICKSDGIDFTKKKNIDTKNVYYLNLLVVWDTII